MNFIILPLKPTRDFSTVQKHFTGNSTLLRGNLHPVYLKLAVYAHGKYQEVVAIATMSPEIGFSGVYTTIQKPPIVKWLLK